MRKRAWVGGGAALGCLVAAGLVWQTSGAAWTSTGSNAGDSWQAGKVVLTNSASTLLFSVGGTGLKPLDTGAQCIPVTYAGNVLATTRLYESGVPAGALAQYVQLTITRADGTGAADCSDFSGLANPVVAVTSSDLLWLGQFAGSWANGIGGFSAGTTTTYTYKFAWVLSNSTPGNSSTTGAQNATTGTATFTWEAQT